MVVAECESDLGLVVLKPVGNEKQALVLYSTQSEEQTTKVRALLLDGEGKPKNTTLELVTLRSALLWLDVIDTRSGPIVLYAVNRDERAEIRAVGLNPNHSLRFADREVASGLRAWQAVKSPDGAALAVVTAGEKGRGGQVSLRLLDDQATLVGKPIELSNEGTAEIDLDLTRVRKAYVLAWSERRRVDSTVMLAAVDAKGNVMTPPSRATRPLGEQSLVRLIPPGPLGKAALLWEELNLPNERRRLSLAEVDENGKIASSTVYLPCVGQGNQVPEIVATSKGWSLLTIDDGAPSTNGEERNPVPVYLELGPEMIARSKQDLRFGATNNEIPLLAWGLVCQQGCRMTAAFDGDNVQIKNIKFGDVGLESSRRAAAQSFVRQASNQTPRLEELESVLEVEPLADFSVNRSAKGFQLSYLTYFEATAPLAKLAKPGPDGRTDPLQARVDVLSLPESFVPSTPTSISFRATSQPGVAVATGNAQDPETVVAWSALDKGQPQVFASLYGVDGKKRTQRMLTHRTGALDEVTAVAVPEGWYVAWLDERGPMGELYGMRLSKTLDRRGGEQKVSQGTGQVTSIALLPQSNYLLAVWSEVKKTAQRRNAELYARRLSLVDGSPLSTATRLLENSGAVKFLTVTPFGSGAVLSWLEVMQEGNSVDAPGRVRYVRLDDRGALVSTIKDITTPNLVPVSLAIDCMEKRCHGVITTDLGGRGELLAFDFDPTVEQAPSLVPLFQSLGTVEQNVAPVLLGNHLFAVDQVDAERARIWHATLHF
jgi:hypothetical protein